MKHVECAMALLAAINLASCSPNKATDMSSCQTEADRLYQRRKVADMDDPRSRYIYDAWLPRATILMFLLRPVVIVTLSLSNRRVSSGTTSWTERLIISSTAK
jgi:hypothetical protein